MKRFPNQPPFGRSWFRVFKYSDHPIAAYRLDWIYFNIQADWQQEAEIRKAEIEYGGFFANPDVYRQVKKKPGVNVGSFKVVYDSSDFDRRLSLAVQGVTEVHDQRSDVAELVKRKRNEHEQRQYIGDPRIIDPKMGVEDEGDELIVERRGK